MIHFYPILASIFVSLVSLVGILFLSLKPKVLDKILLHLVSLSAGTLLGGAFLHLIPEAIEVSNNNVGSQILIGFLLFFIIENLLFWHHCHEKQNCHHLHNLSFMNLIGDAIHNFIDGLIISVSFLSSTQLGLITTFNIALHEIPQEIGDFGVLVHSGLKKSKALAYNLLSASSAIIGCLFGLFLKNWEPLISFILPLAAGGFIYIATTDLIPEIKSVRHKLPITLSFLFGIIIMMLLKD